MRPTNLQQAVRQMDYLLARKVKGSQKTRVKAVKQRAKQIATAIYQRFQVGSYQYQLKHLRWYLSIHIRHLSENMQYRHWLAVKSVLQALDKEADWLGRLQGRWVRPKSIK